MTGVSDRGRSGEAPWLVMRLKRPWAEVQRDKGFDGFFELDYMGASEYEFGAVPDSLKRIRKGGKVSVFPVSLSGKDVFLVCHRQEVDAVLRSLEQHVEKQHGSTKISSWFYDHFHGLAEDFQDRVVAWWALDQDFGFTLDLEQAKLLAEAFNTKKA